jgi:hypothetical protein
MTVVHQELSLHGTEMALGVITRVRKLTFVRNATNFTKYFSFLTHLKLRIFKAENEFSQSSILKPILQRLL